MALSQNVRQHRIVYAYFSPRAIVLEFQGEDQWRCRFLIGGAYLQTLLCKLLYFPRHFQL